MLDWALLTVVPRPDALRTQPSGLAGKPGVASLSSEQWAEQAVMQR